MSTTITRRGPKIAGFRFGLHGNYSHWQLVQRASARSVRQHRFRFDLRVLCWRLRVPPLLGRDTNPDAVRVLVSYVRSIVRLTIAVAFTVCARAILCMQPGAVKC